MTIDEEEIPQGSSGKTIKPGPANLPEASDKVSGKSEQRKKRLAEQLRKNLHNRKTQSRLRRNFDKPDDK